MKIEIRKVSKSETILKIDETEICIVIGRTIKCRQYVTNVRLGKRIDVRLLKQGNRIKYSVDMCAILLETVLKHVLTHTRDSILVRRYKLFDLIRKIFPFYGTYDINLEGVFSKMRHVKCIRDISNRHRCRYVCKLVEPDIETIINGLIHRYSKHPDIQTKIRHLIRFATICNVPLSIVPKIVKLFDKIIHSVKLFYIDGDVIVTGLQLVPFRHVLPDVKCWFSTGTYTSVIYNGDDFYLLHSGYIRKVSQYGWWIHYMSIMYPNVKKHTRLITYLGGGLEKKCFKKYVDFM